MATTTNYFELPVPQSTDYVASGYQAIADLGSSVDTLLAQNPLGGFRNRIINGTLDIWQRGTSFSLTAAGYTSDRWLVSMAGGTTLVARQALSTTDPVTMGAPGSTRFAMSLVNTGQSASSHFIALQQRIENVGTLAGGPVTVSFYAKSASGTPKVGASLDQFFGTGGSPSASVLGDGQSVTINTVWTRYSLTLTLPDLTGKTLGTGGNDWLGLNLWTSAGSDFATRSGSVGINTIGVQITGVQVESGQKFTPLEVRPPQVELALCQRFFTTTAGAYVTGSFFSTTEAALTIRHPVTMRATPVTTNAGTLQVEEVGVAFRTPSTIAYTNNTNGLRLNASGMSSARLHNFAIWTGAPFSINAEL